MLRRFAGQSALKPRSQGENLTWTSPRQYSAQPAPILKPLKAQGIDASKLTVTKTVTPKTLISSNELVFGQSFTGTEGKP